MTTPRADKNAGTPPKTTTRATTYEISARSGDAWKVVGTIDTAGGARTAIRKWAEDEANAFNGGPLRAVPKSNITEITVTVETKRQLTLGAP